MSHDVRTEQFMVRSIIQALNNGAVILALAILTMALPVTNAIVDGMNTRACLEAGHPAERCKQ